MGIVGGKKGRAETKNGRGTALYHVVGKGHPRMNNACLGGCFGVLHRKKQLFRALSLSGRSRKRKAREEIGEKRKKGKTRIEVRGGYPREGAGAGSQWSATIEWNKKSVGSRKEL